MFAPGDPREELPGESKWNTWIERLKVGDRVVYFGEEQFIEAIDGDTVILEEDTPVSVYDLEMPE